MKPFVYRRAKQSQNNCRLNLTTSGQYTRTRRRFLVLKGTRTTRIASLILFSKDQNAQNKNKKQKRAVITEAKETGNQEALLQAVSTNPRHINQQNLVVARALGTGTNFVDLFIDWLADDNIQLLAAAATDASMNHAELLVDFGSKTAATRAMLELMDDYKEINSIIVKNCYDENDYDCNKPIHAHAAVAFERRDKKKTKKEHWFSFSSKDDGDIDHVEQYADELDELRKIIQNWYNCGVVERRTSHHGVSYPPMGWVGQMVNKTITDEHLRSLFLDLLSQASPSDSDSDKLCIEGILNGSFFAITNATVAFHWCYEMLLFGFPSSRSNVCVLNRALWNKLLNCASRKGYSRRYMLSFRSYHSG